MRQLLGCTCSLAGELHPIPVCTQFQTSKITRLGETTCNQCGHLMQCHITTAAKVTPLPPHLCDDPICHVAGLKHSHATDYEHVNHPPHYGGEDNLYEAIKVIRAWGLGFNLGTAAKYLSRAGKKPGESAIKDLEKLVWYVQDEIAELKKCK